MHQASGNDTGSLWQNPLFEDADAHVYVLAENSPAFDLGIQQGGAIQQTLEGHPQAVPNHVWSLVP